MQLEALTAISPIDGRYRRQTEALGDYFSEFALIKYRVWVEMEYFIALSEIPLPQLAGKVSEAHKVAIRKVYQELSLDQAKKIKEIEQTTNHDVKAVEYFIKDIFEELGLKAESEFVHFGLTSQDINNTAIPLSMKLAIEQVIMPQLNLVKGIMAQQSKDWERIPMLARTHGQPASPTSLGKEWQVFVRRLDVQIAQLNQLTYPAKFGGATGNLNAHYVAYPEINWVEFGSNFCKTLGLDRSHPTTQIEHYDNLAAIFDAFKRINTILLDFSKDVWQYVAMEYFKQKLKAGEVGSSAMPHKVNPIDFENAEGNLGIANAILEHLSAKLPISRLQRDLTDSTVLRNVGVPFSHMMIAFKSLEKGLGKLLLNEQKLDQDLENNWAVVAEAVQTILRREGFEKPYEALKALTRTNEQITKTSIHEFIHTLPVTDIVKQELLKITPQNYTGKI
ncbi:MAG: adenylosuccinate lyase [Bacteroidia bacterium]|nr:adenylosuccinate lyase [Bacteroidia bacterium]MCF8426209.1 adenylosuccinate lyase [Bacteroidia bacterium]MCF8446249.1 adenylosuccinate lyase [Bacteroidia bacterium]